VVASCGLRQTRSRMANRRPSVIDLMERNAMWIVRLALPWPYTFIVVSILILILGMLAIVRAPTDVFPSIDIPVISIIRNYNSLPEDMSDRVDLAAG
jgi:hypothetical protein